jgi:hypothetical protein
MIHKIIRDQRLINQQIAGTKFKTPAEIVSWLVAMQAQEYAMAKWAIGLRLPGYTDAIVEKAFNNGDILRTHVMRPTWHFVTPADIRWMQELTAPRVNAFNAFMYRKMEVDTKIFNRCNDILGKSLEGNNYLTRTAIELELKKKKIVANGVRLACILMRAELDKIICSGPRQGKQFTYALMDERAPIKKSISYTKDEALSEICRRYFTSHGPATLQDIAWWSGLTVKDVKAGISMLPKEFVRGDLIYNEEQNRNAVYSPATVKRSSTFLMPDYDEYGISYKDRSAIFNSKKDEKQHPGNKPVSYHMVVIDGLIAGTWRRTVNGGKLKMETVPFHPLNKAKTSALDRAVKKYLAFINEE